MSAYPPSMSLRPLFALLVAIAMLLAPALSRAGAALAAVPDHHGQMMQSDHCKSAPSYVQDGDGITGQGKADPRSCCISMCMAVAVSPLVPRHAVTPHGEATAFPLANQYHGCIAEIATPPPRLA